MPREQLREMLHAVPFVPFEVRMANDRRYPVDHPELALLTPGGGTLIVVVGEEVVAYLATRNICSLEPLLVA